MEVYVCIDIGGWINREDEPLQLVNGSSSCSGASCGINGEVLKQCWKQALV